MLIYAVLIHNSGTGNFPNLEIFMSKWRIWSWIRIRVGRSCMRIRIRQKCADPKGIRIRKTAADIYVLPTSSLFYIKYNVADTHSRI